MNYKTQNIDLAAYLISEGCNLVRVKYHTPNICTIYLRPDKQIPQLEKRYTTGTARVNLVTFLYHRTHLKMLARREGQRTTSVPSLKEKPVFDRTVNPSPHATVWYIDGNNKIQHLKFDPNDADHKRLKETGNLFLTSPEAVEYRHKFNAGK